MPQDIVITPNRGSTTSGAQIAFTGYSGATSIYLKVLPDSSLSFEGSAGQLFSITDNLSSGTIFSVNDITGIPSFDVNANGLVRLAPFAGNVALGTTATSGRLQINTGSATTIGQIIQVASGQSANSFEVRNFSGTVLSSVNASGSIGIGTSAATALLDISSSIPTVVPQKISLTSGATSNALEVYISGALQSYIRPHGGFYFRTNGLFEWSKSVVSLDNSSTDTFLIQGVANANSAGTNSIVMRGYGAGSGGNTERADTRALLVGTRSGNAFAVQGTGRVAVGANYATDGPNTTTDYRGIFIVENSIGIQQTFPSGRLHVNTANASITGMILQGFTSQTANLTEWQNSAGTVIASINASGAFNGLLASGVVTSGEIGNASVVSGNIASGAVGAYHFNATGLASGRSLSTDGTGVLSWATGGGGGLTISDDTSTNATRYLTFTSATTGSISTANVSSTKLTFNPSTGDFTAGGNITANSDIKIKKDIKTIENALEKVKSLRGVSFTRIGTDIKNVGVIAQEVEAVVPELVRESDGLKSVAYGNITALLIEAIKEQSKKIEELENKLCQLTSSQS
jgi:hypothetical protein